MEKKYNSLKEALPSLLEEKARLEEEKNRLETRIVDLKKQEDELDIEIDYFLTSCFQILDKLATFRYAATDFPEKDISILSGISWKSSEYSAIEFKIITIFAMIGYIKINIKINLLDGKTIMNGEDIKEMELLLSEASIIIEEMSVLKRAVNLVRTQKSELLSKTLIELDYSLMCVNRLISGAEDISSIVNVRFKQAYAYHQHLFDAVFNDILNNNSLTWLDSLACIYKFSKINHDSLSRENMKALIEKTIKTNIPAYMYLVAVKINNIPDEDMKQLIAAIVASNDKKYIDYLVLDLSKKGVSKVVRDYMKSLGITVSPENIFDYDNNLANELEQALLEDNLEVLYKHGMYSYEDRAYVLSNIQAGL